MPLTEQELLDYLNQGSTAPVTSPTTPVVSPTTPEDQSEEEKLAEYGYVKPAPIKSPSQFAGVTDYAADLRAKQKAIEKGLQAQDSYFLEKYAPKGDGKDRSYASTFKAGLDMPLERIGISLEALGAKDTGKWLKEITEAPENYASATEEWMNEQDPAFFSQNFGEGRFARALVEQSGQLIGSLAVRGIGLGLAASPVPGGRAIGVPIAVGGPGVFEFLQQVGPILQERLARDDPPRTGQEPTWEDWTYAAGAAGLSGVLNAFGIKNIGVLNSSFTKSALKAGAREGITEGAQEVVTELGAGLGTDQGVADAKTLAKRGYSSGLLGGTLGAGADIAISGPVRLLQEQETVPLAKDEIETKTEEETQRRVESYGALNDYSKEELETLIEQGLGYKRVRLPSDTKDILIDEVKKFTKQSVREEFVEEQVTPLLNPIASEFLIRREQEARFKNMSPLELATFAEQELGIDNYAEWARSQRFDSRVSAENNYADDRRVLARVESDRIKRLALLPFKLDKLNIERKQKELVENLTREELINEAAGMFRVSQDTAPIGRPQLEQMTNSQIAAEISAMSNMLELQRQKFQNENPDQLMSVPLERGAFVESAEGIVSPFSRMLAQGGNARSVIVSYKTEEDYQPIDIIFTRNSVNLDESLPIPKDGDKLVLADNQKDNRVQRLLEEGVLTENQELVSFMGPELENDQAYIANMTMPLGSLPVHDNFFIEKLVGRASFFFNPYGGLGHELGARRKDFEREIRTSKKLAKELAYEYEKGVAQAATDTVYTTDTVKKDIDKLAMAYLRQFGARVPQDKESKERIRQDLEDAKIEQLQTDDATAKERIQEEINYLEDLLGGIQRTQVTIDQLPKSVRQPVLKIRKYIDGLTKRLLQEFADNPNITAVKETLESQIGKYLTGGFKAFEPALGWNPRYSKWWNSEAEKIYQQTINFYLNANKNNPDYTPRMAKRDTDELFTADYSTRQGVFNNLPGVFTTESTQVNLSNPGRILETRGRIPYAIRKALGEIDAPDQSVIASVSKVSQLVETMRFWQDAREINERPGEMLFSPVKKGPYKYKIEENPINPLSNYYTTKDVARMLSLPKEENLGNWAADMFTNYIYDPFILLPKLMVQTGMLLISPATQARNFTGGGFMYISAGHTGKGLPEAINMAKHELFGKTSYENGELTFDGAKARENFAKLQRLGIINTSVRLNEATNLFAQIADGTRNETLGNIVNMLMANKNIPGVKELTTTVGKTYETLENLYAMSDDMWKAAAFASEKQQIQELLNNIQIKDDRTEALDDLYTQLEANPQSNSLPAQIYDLEKDLEANPVTDKPSEELKKKVLEEYAEKMTVRTAGSRSNLAKVIRGKTDLDDMIDEVAAFHVRMTIPNYDYVGNFAKIIRGSPFGSFIAFPTEVIRVVGNQALVSARQATFKISPETMEKFNVQPQRIVFRDDTGKIRLGSPTGQNPFNGSAARKAFLGAFVVGGIGLIAEAILKFIYDIDDEESEALNVVVPEWAKNAIKAPVSGIKEEGGYDYTSLNYTLPYAGLASIQKSIQNAIREGEYTGEGLPQSVIDGMVEWAIEYTNSFTDSAISVRVQLELLNNQDERGNPIWNPNDDWGDVWTDMVAYAADNAGPGLYRDLSRLYKATQEGDDRYDTFLNDPDTGLALAKLMGISASETKLVEATWPISITEFAKQQESAESNIRDFRYETADPAEILKQFDDMQEQSYEHQQQLYFLIESLKALGMPEREIRLQLTERVEKGGVPGIKVDFIRNIFNGRFTPFVLPDSYEEKYTEKINAEKAKERKAGRDPNLITNKWPRTEINKRTRQLKRGKYKFTEHPTLPLEDLED